MAVISEVQDQEEGQSSASSSIGPYDEALKPIFYQRDPLGRKSDLFSEGGAQREVAALVSAAKERDVEERKKHKAEEKAFEDAGKPKKRLQEVEPPKESNKQKEKSAPTDANGRENVRTSFVCHEG